MEDIKHDVMANYLFQQQCSAQWIDEDTGDEGVILRKRKGSYLTCPPHLLESSFAQACIALNLHVRKLGTMSNHV